MYKGRLRIELLSDMCCGSGEGDGIAQDIASTYDEYGLPMIYGKRIKGMLRDRFVLMKEYGFLDFEAEDCIFGNGRQQGKLKIGNAELEKADAIKKELEILPEDLADLCCAANIERFYTVNRFATAVEKTGIAKAHSLRTLGAFPKGLVFFADIEADFAADSREYEALEAAVALLRNLGMSKNRGMGEVKCSLEATRENTEEKMQQIRAEDCVAEYVVETLSPLSLQTDYLPGTSLQGWFAGQVVKGQGNHLSIERLLQSVKFGTAYVAEKEKGGVYHAYEPLPLGMLQVKNEEKVVYSISDGYQVEKNKQYVRLSGYFRREGEKIRHKQVQVSREYHITKKDKNIFMLKSLCTGQYFKGEIHAEKPEYLQDLAEIVRQNKGMLCLGSSSGTQYGRCRLHLIKFRSEKRESLCSRSKILIVELLSDTILIDSCGVNGVSRNCVKENFADILPGYTLRDVFCTTLPVGGYNAKWKLPKRRFMAFSKGSQLVFSRDTEEEVWYNPRGQVGLLQTEGYGSYRVRECTVQKSFSVILEEGKKTQGEERQNVDIDAAKELLQGILLKKVREALLQRSEKSVCEYLEKQKGLSVSCAMRLLSAYKATDKEENFAVKFKNHIQENFAGDSNADIRKFADHAEEAFQKILDGIQTEATEKSELYRKSLAIIVKEKRDFLLHAFVQAYIAETKLYFRGM
ncbi:RAMP superfamily CRISPR-associated protein [Bacteroides heparinolyticus]|uniref:RAMP superfamily CRISPR-associated protein n=1 Tax=Prevotella heparinolytica TaxID=28113 RepID=UPI0035A1CF96